MPYVNTRLAAALLAAVLLPLPHAHAAQPTPQPVVQQQAGGYHVRVGDVPVVALSDGTVPMDVHALLSGASREDIDRLLARSFQRNPVEASINMFLVNLPGRRVLIDTGAGQMLGDGIGGRLVEALATQGVRAEDVTDILLTHAHSDHLGGLIKDGQRVFPKATIHVSKPELDFFLDDKARQDSGYDVAYFDVARSALKPYLAANQIRTFVADEEILPGITATIHPGHTPGSAFFRLNNAGETLTFVGDIVHVAAVQLANPDVSIDYDQDPAQAAATRKAALATFARDQALIAGAHIAFPGIGRVRAGADQGYDWVPINYTDRDAR